MVSGESLPFIKALDFTTKEQLLNMLKGIMADAAELAAPDNRIVREMTDLCIQEISVCPKPELLALKRYLTNKKHTGGER
jgi:hypothetical protein